MNVILLGFPGSGKGTQAKAVAERLGMLHFSTGDIFREEIAKKSELGEKVQSYLASGRLVPDEVVIEVIKSRVTGANKGLMFDGFPRTVEQAQALDEFFEARGEKIDAVVFLAVPEQEVVGRLTSRRTCAKCGKIYNLNSNPPAAEGKCDDCGSALTERDDDKPEVVAKRLMVYKALTEPLISYYRGNGVFLEVPGALEPAAVTEGLLAALAGKTA
ncbi:MAG: adenylate kinase [Elusimicrobiales bacterium]|jgi:adenylate kinase|nr:adenylate kinase [Elusimicrobiales bacterium]